jgi:hypothetical protein
MPPPPNQNFACQGCFLQEQRSGRVCPTARTVYGLPDVSEAQRRADVLHAAVVADAQSVPAFADLVRRDALSRAVALPASISLGLLPAPPLNPLFHDSRKEAVRVAIPSRTTR